MSPSLPNLTLDGRGVVSFEDFVPFLFMVFLFGVCLVLRRYCSYRPQGGRVVMRRTVCVQRSTVDDRLNGSVLFVYCGRVVTQVCVTC